MIRFPTLSDQTQKLIISNGIELDHALDGAELIPIDCGGRLIAPTLTVNELGKQLLRAAAEGNIEDTKTLLNRGALFTADWLGTSPLHLAARNNHLEICEILLRAGISRDARTKVDKTSLHMAAYEGHVSIVEALLEYGADPDCRDLLGMTPLHWAVQNGHQEVVKMLTKHYAQAHPMNKFDLTPSDIAAQIDRPDIIEILSAENVSEPGLATQHLALQLAGDSEENSLQSSDIISNSPIPLETILLEGNENSIDTSKFHLFKQNVGLDDPTEDTNNDDNESESNNTFAESIKLLQEHGITMLQNEAEEDNNILTTVMQTGHSVVLTDVGKEVLNSLKESEAREAKRLAPISPKKNIITVTPEEFLAMTSSCNTNKNILKQINGRLVPKNVKRIVMKKNKIVPVSTINNVFKAAKASSSNTDMETVMMQLIEARKTIEEYKIKLYKKEQEAERYKQQLKLLMEES